MVWVCRGCGVGYGLRLSRCRVCGASDLGEEVTVPKITVHGGPSIEPPAGGQPEQPGPDEPDEEEGERPSPGSSSSTSDEKPPSKPGPSGTVRRSRARTTGNR